MKATVRTLDNKEVGDIELSEDVFGLPVRPDILVSLRAGARSQARQTFAVPWPTWKRRSPCSASSDLS